MFLCQIIEIFKNPPLSALDTIRAEKDCRLMMGQLNFLMSFVDDLIDLRQLSEGQFRLLKEPFNLQKVLELIFDIFTPQARAKNIELRIDFGSSDQGLINLFSPTN